MAATLPRVSKVSVNICIYSSIDLVNGSGPDDDLDGLRNDAKGPSQPLLRLGDGQPGPDRGRHCLGWISRWGVDGLEVQGCRVDAHLLERGVAHRVAPLPPSIGDAHPGIVAELDPVALRSLPRWQGFEIRNEADEKGALMRLGPIRVAAGLVAGTDQIAMLQGLLGLSTQACEPPCARMVGRSFSVSTAIAA